MKRSSPEETAQNAVSVIQNALENAEKAKEKVRLAQLEEGEAHRGLFRAEDEVRPALIESLKETSRRTLVQEDKERFGGIEEDDVNEGYVGTPKHGLEVLGRTNPGLAELIKKYFWIPVVTIAVLNWSEIQKVIDRATGGAEPAPVAATAQPENPTE
ncbi:hypothetical protein KA119_00110 [Candidatus Gracilibacteria bacterium]|nr:hypothetical protein [Candidatus Gracilibacteria bacterium]